uniref:Plant natriuretic peptide-like 1 n=1 Tax=Venturia pyrina TaxID=415593 RepID=A0A513ZSA1_9PEZI|nr:plant natriuretic peptide-like 1 [Venturia pyrina]
MKAPTALIAISYFAHLVCGEVGPAAVYKPPYRPNKCYGWSEDAFPSTKMFAAAGQTIWDNGAACGRWYQIRCMSPGIGSRCTGKTITVRIVEGKPGFRSPVFSLSQTAGAELYTGTGRVQVEYHQVSSGR